MNRLQKGWISFFFYLFVALNKKEHFSARNIRNIAAAGTKGRPRATAPWPNLRDGAFSRWSVLQLQQCHSLLLLVPSRQGDMFPFFSALAASAALPGIPQTSVPPRTHMGDAAQPFRRRPARVGWMWKCAPHITTALLSSVCSHSSLWLICRFSFLNTASIADGIFHSSLPLGLTTYILF